MEVTVVNSLVLFNPSDNPYVVGIIIPIYMPILRSHGLSNLLKAMLLVKIPPSRAHD